jgi:glutathione S-transferase
MSANLTVYQLAGSPNNVKVRVALGYKGIPYETHDIAAMPDFPGDRSAIVAATTQPRTPAIRHGDVALFDSSAILRYLDANFPETPRLYSEDYVEIGEIERWELFQKTALSEPIGMIFGQAFASEKDPAVLASAQEKMRAATSQLEDALASKGFLVGERLTAADVTCACFARLADLSGSDVTSPIGQLFCDALSLGDGRDAVRAWLGKVLAYDTYEG